MSSKLLFLSMTNSKGDASLQSLVFDNTIVYLNGLLAVFDTLIHTSAYVLTPRLSSESMVSTLSFEGMSPLSDTLLVLCFHV